MNIQKSPFWLHPRPLILASKSAIRLHMLAQLQLYPIAVAAEIDERLIEAGLPHDAISARLAQEKALCVAQSYPDHIVMGSDQTLTSAGKIFHKPSNRDDAEQHLRALSGQVHQLQASAALACNGQVLFETTQIAVLKMRPLSPEFRAAYLETMGEAVLSTVGAYQIEGLGLHLFESIEGDHFTILGCPLLPVLHYLRQTGALL